MTTFLEGVKQDLNYTVTYNGATTYKSTFDPLLDLFAMGGAYQERSDEDVIRLFSAAFYADPLNALKCLFYLRDVRGGQGVRRFFRVALHWLATKEPNIVLQNITLIPKFGRWDDLYCLIDTPIESVMFKYWKHQFIQDLTSENVSLAAKWAASENTSSAATRAIGEKMRKGLVVTSKQYRHILSKLRAKIKLVESQMSQNEWDKIEFDKLPSKAGFKYRQAFQRNASTSERYAAFINNKDTKVHAGTLYPYEVVQQALHYKSTTDWQTLNKYWDNLTDYFNNAKFNALCVIDTSASMTWGSNVRPIDVAVSLGLYCAECNKGPFANHYISFSRRPQLIECEGVDFVDKVRRIANANLCENTDIEATFDLILSSAVKHDIPSQDLPQNLIIISDMEFDAARGNHQPYQTLFETIKQKWDAAGYIMPHLIFWNVNAMQDNIPMMPSERISFISGFSAATFEQLMSGKSGRDLMMEKLNSMRYSEITCDKNLTLYY